MEQKKIFNYTCVEWRECKSEQEYIENYLNNNDTIEDASYQYIYDETKDWIDEEYDCEIARKAFEMGAKWMEQKIRNKNEVD